MAATLLATTGLGQEVDVRLVDASRGPTRLQPREDRNDRFVLEVRNRAEEVETTARRTEIVREETARQLTALRQVSRRNTLREIIRNAQGELSGGGLLINNLA